MKLVLLLISILLFVQVSFAEVIILDVNKNSSGQWIVEEQLVGNSPENEWSLTRLIYKGKIIGESNSAICNQFLIPNPDTIQLLTPKPIGTLCKVRISISAFDCPGGSAFATATIEGLNCNSTVEQFKKSAPIHSKGSVELDTATPEEVNNIEFIFE